MPKIQTYKCTIILCVYLPQLFLNTIPEPRVLTKNRTRELELLNNSSQARFFQAAKLDSELDLLISLSTKKMKAYIDTHVAAKRTPEEVHPVNNLK